MRKTSRTSVAADSPMCYSHEMEDSNGEILLLPYLKLETKKKQKKKNNSRSFWCTPQKKGGKLKILLHVRSWGSTKNPLYQQTPPELFDCFVWQPQFWRRPKMILRLAVVTEQLLWIKCCYVRRKIMTPRN